MKRIVATIFSTSLVSYFVFALADYVRPGFVSHVFSVHWFLVPTLVSGIWWAKLEKHEHRPSVRSRMAGLPARFFAGLALLILFWQEGEVFGDLRIFVAVVAFLTPWIILSRPKSTR